jgi:hypothetical protein
MVFHSLMVGASTLPCGFDEEARDFVYGNHRESAVSRDSPCLPKERWQRSSPRDEAESLEGSHDQEGKKHNGY